MPALGRSDGGVDGADVEHRGDVEIAGVHHIRYALERCKDHGLFPIREPLVAGDERLLQGRGRRPEGPFSLCREVRVYLALIHRAAFSIHEPPPLKAIENRGDRRLAQLHFPGDGADGDVAQARNSGEDEELGGGQASGL